MKELRKQFEECIKAENKIDFIFKSSNKKYIEWLEERVNYKSTLLEAIIEISDILDEEEMDVKSKYYKLWEIANKAINKALD